MGELLGGRRNVTAKWFEASQNSGCGGANTTAEATVQCMRKVPFKKLLAAIKPQGAGANLGGMGDYGPMVDGKVVFGDYSARAAAGNFIKRPVLVGNNANEISLFSVILGQSKGLEDPFISYVLGLGNSIFHCPSGDVAKARANNKVPVWRYQYAGDFPNLKIAEGAGAFHGSEIGMAFGTVEYQQAFYTKMTGLEISFPSTSEQAKLEKKMVTVSQSCRMLVLTLWYLDDSLDFIRKRPG